MGCASNRNQYGFTLVEISIVMIIIGLLIGGTFGGMKLIENMQVNKTVQDLKAIESAALTFKDTYGRLPGDIVNPAARLPNCTVAPCATGGNGNRRIENIATWSEAISAAHEKFTFWSHLQAADFLSIGTKNTTDLSFGEGQPESPIGTGYRLTSDGGIVFATGAKRFENSLLMLISLDSVVVPEPPALVSQCSQLAEIDRKIDDGIAYNGFAQGWVCSVDGTTTGGYNASGNGVLFYDLKGF